MDDEINNTHHLSIFKEVPCLVNENVIMPQWVFCCKFKHGTLIKYKAWLVAQGFTQVPGIDYCKSYLCMPVVCLKSFHILILITALFDLVLHQFIISTTYLHGEINGEVYMELPARCQSQCHLAATEKSKHIWHEWLKVNMQEIRFIQCSRDHAVFCIGTWKSDGVHLWVGNETGTGPTYQLEWVSMMFSHNCGFLGIGELTWTLSIAANQDHNTHIISLSQEL